MYHASEVKKNKLKIVLLFMIQFNLKKYSLRQLINWKENLYICNAGFKLNYSHLLLLELNNLV